MGCHPLDAPAEAADMKVTLETLIARLELPMRKDWTDEQEMAVLRAAAAVIETADKVCCLEGPEGEALEKALTDYKHTCNNEG